MGFIIISSKCVYIYQQFDINAVQNKIVRLRPNCSCNDIKITSTKIVWLRPRVNKCCTTKHLGVSLSLLTKVVFLSLLLDDGTLFSNTKWCQYQYDQLIIVFNTTIQTMMEWWSQQNINGWLSIEKMKTNRNVFTNHITKNP